MVAGGVGGQVCAMFEALAPAENGQDLEVVARAEETLSTPS